MDITAMTKCTEPCPCTRAPVALATLAQFAKVSITGGFICLFVD